MRGRLVRDLMRVELVYFEECPGWRGTEANLREALDQLGHGSTTVHRVAVSTQAEAVAARMHGSPTVLVDGRDAFADAQAPVAMACRLYGTGTAESGTGDQLTVNQLKEALLRS